MNKNALRELVAYVFFVISLTGVIVLLYGSAKDEVLALLKGEDYILYAPQLFPVLFVFPAVFIFYIYCITCCLFFPFRYKFKVIAERLIVLLGFYCMVAIFLGVVTSFVVSIYPLSTHYYKCDSTSIISSGSYYARTKEMCKEQKKLRIEKFMGKESAQENSSILRE